MSFLSEQLNNVVPSLNPFKGTSWDDPFKGVSWDKPLGDSGNFFNTWSGSDALHNATGGWADSFTKPNFELNLLNAIRTGEGTPWGPGGKKGFENVPGFMPNFNQSLGGELGKKWNELYDRIQGGVDDALFTGAGTPWGAGGEKGLKNIPGTLPNFNQSLGGDFGKKWNELYDKVQGGFDDALFTGKQTPWGAGGEKGLQNTAPLNFANIFEPTYGWQKTMDDAFNPPGEYTPGSFDEDKYTSKDYSETERDLRTKIAQNLSRQQNDIVASNQGRGTLNSGSASMGLSDALSASNTANQDLASYIAGLQYQDKKNQFYADEYNRQQKYLDQLDRYRTGLSTLGSTAGAVASLVL
jgi:hypothetical protein